MDLSLSVVRPMPWKLVRQFLPWTSSHTSLNFLNDLSASFSFCRSARETSETRPLRPSEAILVPAVLFTKVLPTWRTLKREGALMSYQSFLVKGSTTFFLAPFLRSSADMQAMFFFLASSICCWSPKTQTENLGRGTWGTLTVPEKRLSFWGS